MLPDPASPQSFDRTARTGILAASAAQISLLCSALLFRDGPRGSPASFSRLVRVVKQKGFQEIVVPKECHKRHHTLDLSVSPRHHADAEESVAVTARAGKMSLAARIATYNLANCGTRSSRAFK